MKASIKNKLLFFLYPFRDSVGVMAGSTPYRVGEIYTFIYGLLNIFRKKDYANLRINKRVRNIVILLFLNLILTSIISVGNSDTIDTDFLTKYIIRNILTLFLFVSIYRVYVAFDDDLMVKGFKWNIILQLLAAVLFFAFSQRMYINHLTSIWDMQTASYGNMEIPRFQGTSSEAGYLGPLLAMPLFYFLSSFKENKIWFFLTAALLVVSVSTANFFFLFLAFAFFIYKRNRHTFFKMVIYFLIAAFVLVLVDVYFLRDTIFYTILENNYNKFLAYITLGGSGQLDWSASDRVQHLSNAANMFTDGSILQIILGHGTGAYSYAASHNARLLVQNVEEAYNLYLSTLTDRGLVGLVILIAIYYNVYKIKTNNKISDAIWFGLAIQLIHYMIVGNMWLYYVWQEVLFLIGYEIFLDRKKSNNIKISKK